MIAFRILLLLLLSHILFPVNAQKIKAYKARVSCKINRKQSGAKGKSLGISCHRSIPPKDTCLKNE
jgi:hypothetical protein